MESNREDNKALLPEEWMKAAERVKQTIQRLWNSENRYKILVVLGLIGMGLIFCSEMIPQKQTTQTLEIREDKELDNQAYIQETEQKLCEIIGQIDGVGECSVMVTLQEGSRNVYASEKKTSTEKSRDSSDTEMLRTQDDNASENKLVLVEDEKGVSRPVVEKVIEPQIKGVVVVCRGAKSAKVCEQVTQAVTTVLGIRSTQVCVSPKSR